MSQFKALPTTIRDDNVIEYLTNDAIHDTGHHNTIQVHLLSYVK